MSTSSSAKFNTPVCPTWCPGCGNFGVWAALKQALIELGLEPHQVLIVYDIGCAGNGDQNMEPEDIPKEVMNYIKEKHLDAAPFIKENIFWARSSGDMQVGYSWNIYTGDGWTLTVGHAVTPETIYDVKAEHEDEGIVWVGTIKEGVISEESYSKGEH